MLFPSHLHTLTHTLTHTVGQVALEPGEAKNTYGTGMFLMMNTGTKLVPSNHGLLTTIAYRIGGEIVYALEGSVSHSGSTVQWLRDQLKIISKASESETLASETNDGLYLVPAFAASSPPTGGPTPAAVSWASRRPTTRATSPGPPWRPPPTRPGSSSRPSRPTRGSP